MTLQEYDWLLADLAELDALIAMTPKSDVIDHMSLEYRRSQVVDEIKAFRAPERWPAAGSLAFYGKPVMDGRGIDAVFLGKATEAFANAATSAAASRRAPMGENGAAPIGDDCRLLISGGNTGFGGFRFEEATAHDALEAGPAPIGLGIEHMLKILRASVKGDDALNDAVSDAPPSVVEALRRFLDILVSGEAVFSLSFEGEKFSFDDVEQARTSLSRLSEFADRLEKSAAAER